MTKNWRKNEKEIMRSLNITPTPNSGAGPLYKEDGYTETLLAQLKSTESKVVHLALADWKELVKHSHITHKRPLFILQFVDGPLLLCMLPGDIQIVAEHFSLSSYSQEVMQEYVYDESSPVGEQLEKLL